MFPLSPLKLEKIGISGIIWFMAEIILSISLLLWTFVFSVVWAVAVPEINSTIAAKVEILFSVFGVIL